MNTLDMYQKIKNEESRATLWAEKLGKIYHGGGGGVGELVTVKIANIEIYFQAYDGAMNYFEAPEPFKNYLEKSIIINSAILVDAALSLLREDLRKSAEAALDTHSELLKSSGLVTRG